MSEFYMQIGVVKGYVEAAIHRGERTAQIDCADALALFGGIVNLFDKAIEYKETIEELERKLANAENKLNKISDIVMGDEK